MKRIIQICGALLLTTIGFAQAPERMSYQAVIRDGNDELIRNQTVGMQISVLQGSSTGTAVYVETHVSSTNNNGLVSLEIGNGTLVSGNFSTIDWGNGLYFIKSETDITGGTNYSITGNSQLLSVPYALYAKTTGTISNSNFLHYVGELYGGGIVVAVWKESGIEHGLIASLTDVSSGAKWTSFGSVIIGQAAKSPIDGQGNTTAIITQGDVSGAAYLCDNYSSGGFDDWYLPAIWELNLCYNSAFVVNTILGPTDGFQFQQYWSSTEDGTNWGWLQRFTDGYADSYPKTGIFYVRAVRRF